jgi:hypothetical protein
MLLYEMLNGSAGQMPDKQQGVCHMPSLDVMLIMPIFFVYSMEMRWLSNAHYMLYRVKHNN